MEMKRSLNLAALMVLLAGFLLLGATDPVPSEAAPPASTSAAEAAAPADAPEDKAVDRVLVLRAEGAKFKEAMDGLDEELGGEVELQEKMLTPSTSAGEIAAALAAGRHKAVVLMDNQAIRLYAAVQAAWKDAVPFPPAVALMAVRVDKAVDRMRKVTGIFYEVPGVTIMVNLRSLLKDPVRKVGVIHRGAMEDFVKESAKWLEAERIELVPYRLPDGLKEGPRVPKALRAGVRKLWRKDDVDALWVLNDNFYLTPEVIREGWLPALERFEKPVVVGVENFVSPGIKFGTYAVLPDHYGLGVQAAGLLLRLKDDAWAADDAPALRQPLAITKLLNLRLIRKYSRIHEDRLMEIDRVVK